MTRLTYRDAVAADLGFIVRLIVEDNVVPTADLPNEPDHPRYLAALAAIDADPNQRLVVAELAGQPVGTLQLTFIPGINRLGETRCLIEAVHIVPTHRNLGLGAEISAGPSLKRASAAAASSSSPPTRSASTPTASTSASAFRRATKASSWRSDPPPAGKGDHPRT